ncbi:ABC transporter ATP-binding protein [Roseomonas terrae]|jgi:peptide/nickel transport system ATP-binding protein|uniref:ABC transporter ATP-binding protein n=1 Tax=Neoroseomonas terrae TaxID=424799 RepID=A0ABS5EGQ7_9PROT|nr:ABC transporter ATP-binding protein [Neoroseomonas terrae]MBR0650214.1 ABC transporter ATP-binding protein [Neoroseomonas terrae]
MSGVPLLQARELVRRYTMRRGLMGRPVEVRAVDGVTLALERGRTLGLVGESGCGKSTTGRLVLGLEVPDGGNVTFREGPMPPRQTAEWRRLRARMAMVYQDPLGALDRRLPIGTQIAEPLDIHGIGSRADRPERVAQLLRDVGLRPDHAQRYPHELSGGQRQRAVLARALATGPELLVCDEPISALDVSIQAQVMNLLAEVQERSGIALLFISHDLRAVRQMSHRVAVMYLGRIVEEGDPDAVLHSPAHPYSQALVSAIPQPGRGGRRIILQGDPPNPAARPSGCAFHPRCALAAALCSRAAPVLKPLPDGRLAACHVAHGTVSPRDGMPQQRAA